MGRPEQFDREGMLVRGEVLHLQAGAVPRQIGPLRQVRVGEIAADQAALLLVKARDEGASASGGVIGCGCHGVFPRDGHANPSHDIDMYSMSLAMLVTPIRRSLRDGDDATAAGAAVRRRV